MAQREFTLSLVQNSTNKTVNVSVTQEQATAVPLTLTWNTMPINPNSPKIYTCPITGGDRIVKSVDISGIPSGESELIISYQYQTYSNTLEQCTLPQKVDKESRSVQYGIVTLPYVVQSITSIESGSGKYVYEFNGFMDDLE